MTDDEAADHIGYADAMSELEAILDDLEDDALSLEPEQRLEHHQVPRARDRQELGESLHQPQQGRLQQIHALPHPRAGAGRRNASGRGRSRPVDRIGRPPPAV